MGVWIYVSTAFDEGPCWAIGTSLSAESVDKTSASVWAYGPLRAPTEEGETEQWPTKLHLPFYGSKQSKAGHMVRTSIYTYIYIYIESVPLCVA